MCAPLLYLESERANSYASRDGTATPSGAAENECPLSSLSASSSSAGPPAAMHVWVSAPCTSVSTTAAAPILIGSYCVICFEGEEDAPGPTAHIPSGGPAEPIVCRALSVFATALAMLQIVHLLVIRRFNDKFLHHALSVPSDTSLRGPSLQEILAADRSVWQAVHTLLREDGWFLTDCLNDMAFCRQDIPSCLQPRPRAHSQPPSRLPPSDDGPDVPPPPAGKKRKRTKGTGKSKETDPSGKAKASVRPAAQDFDKSWFKKVNGEEVCMRAETRTVSSLMSPPCLCLAESPVARSTQLRSISVPSID